QAARRRGRAGARRLRPGDPRQADRHHCRRPEESDHQPRPRGLRQQVVMRARYLLWFLAVFAIDCASLDHVDDGTCGNGVIDAKEDCDTFDVGDNSCGAPQTATACKLLCVTDKPGTPLCPDGWGCSVSGICRQPKGVLETAGDALSAGVATMEVGDFDGD